jgi:serine/threonine protein kinase
MNQAVWNELQKRYVSQHSEDAPAQTYVYDVDDWIRSFMTETLGFVGFPIPIGSGRFGSIYQIPYTPALGNVMEGLSNKVVGVPLPSSGNVVLKFVMIDYSINRIRPHKAFVDRTTKENIMHRYVFRDAPTITVPLYFGGTFRHVPIHVSCMGVAPGKTLDRYIKARMYHRGVCISKAFLYPEEYSALEDAFRKLLVTGYLHTDLHTSNIMFDPETYRVAFIDFGFALKLPASLRAKIADLADKSLTEIWEESGLHEYVKEHDADIMGPMRYSVIHNIERIQEMQRLVAAKPTKRQKI